MKWAFTEEALVIVAVVCILGAGFLWRSRSPASGDESTPPPTLSAPVILPAPEATSIAPAPAPSAPTESALGNSIPATPAEGPAQTLAAPPLAPAPIEPESQPDTTATVIVPDLPVETPAAAVEPAPSSGAPAAPRVTGEETGTATEAPVLSVELSAVQRALRQYEEAFNRLDVAAAAAVWPSIDRRAVTRAFERLERQEMVFNDCSVALTATNATADCTGTLLFVPRVGTASARPEPHSWTIRLQGSGDGWRIVAVSAQ